MATTTTTKRRARIRPGGIFSGLLCGFALLILMQQFGTLYPTMTLTIIFLVGGLLIGLLLPWLAGSMRARGGSTPVAATAAATPAAATAAEATPAATGTGAWTPTHTVPAGGLDTYAGPADANPSERLDGGLEVQVDERAGNRAHVICSNGWSCWVEGADLQATGG
jgi:predicted lipid-binding transport protein (Tim44 family)